MRKSFPHFDLPLDFQRAKELVSDPDKVAAHAFRPFIGYTDTRRRFTPTALAKYKNKERPIKYCSHHDGYIHSYYAKVLTEAYENYISGKTWAKCPVGYRSGLGRNIHLANDAFNEIRKRASCVVIAIDITDFFGSIDHRVLLNNIKSVLARPHLSDDWFAVFKSMTRYAWVESDDLEQKLGIDLKKPPRPLCSTNDFRAHRANHPQLVKSNKGSGIPQGSPISAVFSNVYMIQFDEEVHKYVKSIGGYYRRYSDDIFIVCPTDYENAVIKKIKSEIQSLGSEISISDEKTEISHFHRTGDILSCDEPISYLGFTFDGNRILLRARTLSRYYRRMTYATRHAATAAWKAKSAKIFKRKLYRQFTHLGDSNFYSYAQDSLQIFGDDTPKRQLRRHISVLNRKLQNRGR